MKPAKAWVWETADAKRFLEKLDAVNYSKQKTLSADKIRKARAQIWVTEDGVKFFEYGKAFQHESKFIEM